jgi:hypothetical protein
MTARTRPIAGVAIALAGLLLGGCYESKTDLIGSHASPVTVADTYVTFRNHTYVPVSVGNELVLCELSAPAAASRSCSAPLHLKFERQIFGDYLVQIRRGDTLYYALWSRAGQKFDSNDNCTLLLGEDIVASLTDGLLGADRPRRFGGERYQELVDALAPYRDSGLRGRDQLLAIVAVYHRTVLLPFKPVCPGDQVGISNPRGVVIQGDNRHLPAFE